MDTKKLLNIDFNDIRKSFREFVRAKAIAADSTIVYGLNGQVIEEDPKTGKIYILHQEVIGG